MQRGNYYEPLVQQIQNGLATLFMPKSHENEMKYMMMGSQINGNNAQARASDAQAQLYGEQSRGHRINNNNATYLSNPSNIASVFPNLPPEQLGTMGAVFGSNPDADTLNKLLSMQMLLYPNANGAPLTEEQAHIAMALQGRTVDINSPVTRGGMADVFNQALKINNANNATQISMNNADNASLEKRERMTQNGQNFRNNQDNLNKLYTVNGSLFDRVGNLIATAPNQNGSNNSMVVNPQLVEGFRSLLFKSLPNTLDEEGNEVSPFLKPDVENAIVGRAVEIFKETKNAQLAIQQALAEATSGVGDRLTITPGTDFVPGIVDDDEMVAPTVTGSLPAGYGVSSMFTPPPPPAKPVAPQAPAAPAKSVAPPPANKPKAPAATAPTAPAKSLQSLTPQEREAQAKAVIQDFNRRLAIAKKKAAAGQRSQPEKELIRVAEHNLSLLGYKLTLNADSQSE